MGTHTVIGASSGPLECVPVCYSQAAPVVSQKWNSWKPLTRKHRCAGMFTESEHSSPGSRCFHVRHLAVGPESSVLPVATRGSRSLVPCSGTKPAKCEHVRKCNPLFLQGLTDSQGCKSYVSPFRLTELWDLQATCRQHGAGLSRGLKGIYSM